MPFPGLKFSKLQTHTYQETILPPNFILPELENPQEKNKPGLVFFCVNLKIGIVEKMKKPPGQIEEVEFEAIAAKLKERYANILDYLKNSQLLEAAFIIDKNFKSQELIDIISEVDTKLIKNIRIFDVYEGENIPTNKKSVALNVTIQSSIKTLKDDDLNEIAKKIISTVENKTGAKIRS